MPDTDGRPIVDLIREYEEHNYQATLALLGDTAGVTDLLSGLYDVFPRAFSEAELPAHDKYVSPLTFALSCQYQLVIAALAAERGHLTDAFQATRRAVESCAFARKISLHPHLAMVWLEAGHSEDAYDLYMSKFGKLFPKNDPVMAKLGERYDYASKQMHSTVHSMARRLKYSEGTHALNVDFAYFELDGENKSEPVGTLLWIWDTHLGIIQAFGEILADALKAKPAKAAWKMKLTSVEAALSYHKESWRQVVLEPRGMRPDEQGS